MVGENMSDSEYVLARFHRQIEADLTNGREEILELTPYTPYQIKSYIEKNKDVLSKAVEEFLADIDGSVYGEEADSFRATLYEHVDPYTLP